MYKTLKKEVKDQFNTLEVTMGITYDAEAQTYSMTELTPTITILTKARRDLDKTEKLLRDLESAHGLLLVKEKNAQKKKVETIRKRFNSIRGEFFKLED